MPDELRLSDQEWRTRLTPEAYRVLCQHGTEPPFEGCFLGTTPAPGPPRATTAPRSRPRSRGDFLDIDGLARRVVPTPITPGPIAG